MCEKLTVAILGDIKRSGTHQAQRYTFPVPRPAFRRCLVRPLYRTKQRRKAGRGTGNEARLHCLNYLFTPHSLEPIKSLSVLATILSERLCAEMSELYSNCFHHPLPDNSLTHASCLGQ